MAFRRVPRKKASGLDQLPSELCGACPCELARQNYGALLKFCLHGQESLWHKGGILYPAHKGKGPLSDPKAYRSLLVSSHVGKALHRTIRQTQAGLLESYMMRSQLGGKRHVPVTLGLHEARAYLRAAAAKGHSAILLMVDLVEAFYRVLRPLALGSDYRDDDIARIAQKLRLPDDVLHQLHAHLADPSAIAKAGMTKTAQQVLQAIHSDTFFRCRGRLTFAERQSVRGLETHLRMWSLRSSLRECWRISIANSNSMSSRNTFRLTAVLIPSGMAILLRTPGKSIQAQSGWMTSR